LPPASGHFPKAFIKNICHPIRNGTPRAALSKRLPISKMLQQRKAQPKAQG